MTADTASALCAAAGVVIMLGSAFTANVPLAVLALWMVLIGLAFQYRARSGNRR